MKCQICGSNNVTHIFTFVNPRRIGNRRLSYWQCQKCKLVFLFPKFSSKNLDKIYSTQEYFTNLCRPVTSPILQRILSLRFFPEYDEFVQSNSRGNGNHLLDIGCGNGEFLRLMQKRGWNVYGADPSTVAIKNARKLVPKGKYKIGKIYNLKFPQKFDVITLWHVLEHEPNPRRMVNSLSQLLTPHGKIYLEVPNSDSFMFRLFKSHYNWLMAPEHIYYYSASSLTYLFAQSGFKIKRIDYPPRALLNFGLSSAKKSKILALIAFPLSPFIGIIAAIFRRSEVVRIIITL